MSFDLYILSGAVQAEDSEELLELLEDPGHWGGELVPELQGVVDALKATFPTLEDDPDASPWSTHPLEQTADAGRILTLNIGWSHVESAVPEIERICADRHLRIFDPQHDTIAVPSVSRSGRSLFRRLFRR